MRGRYGLTNWRRQSLVATIFMALERKFLIQVLHSYLMNFHEWLLKNRSAYRHNAGYRSVVDRRLSRHHQGLSLKLEMKAVIRNHFFYVQISIFLHENLNRSLVQHDHLIWLLQTVISRISHYQNAFRMFYQPSWTPPLVNKRFGKIRHPAQNLPVLTLLFLQLILGKDASPSRCWCRCWCRCGSAGSPGHKAELNRNFSPLAMLGLAFAILNSWTALAASLSLALPSGGPTSVLWGLISKWHQLGEFPCNWHLSSCRSVQLVAGCIVGGIPISVSYRWWSVSLG